ncbi:MAG: TAXI family TRAP transporter solute-binding subunit [Deltaproteobacteria bacterium]|nr:TAXI family TRAP transporter solute-binding subunit [Deltaproteobacteria bacterium]
MKIYLKMVIFVFAFLLISNFAIAKTTLTMAAIGKTSDTYMIAVGWSNALKNAKSDIAITPLEGGGTVKLLRGVASGKWDIGFIASPHYINALEGTLKFKKDPPNLRAKYKKIRSLFGVTTGMGQYVVRADSGIKTIRDFKGKKVGIGRPGGMGGTVTQAIFKAHGVDAAKGDFKPQYLKYVPALDEMRNKRLDGTLVWGGIPQAAVYNFSRRIPVRFLPIDKAAFERFKKNMPQGEYYVLREFTPADLKKGYGDGVKQEVPADFWTFQMQVVVRDDMPEDVVYKIVKVFWENLDAIKATGAALQKLNRKDALEALSAKIHPGALKYYKERGWK